MGGFNLVVANDIADAALSYYVRGDALAQTIQDKPMLQWLRSNQETFPGGKDVVSLPVRGRFMSDNQGFIQAYKDDDALTFMQAQSIKRATYAWKELHAGLVISWTELKKDGITVNDNQKTSEHSKADLTRLTGLLRNRLDDYMESYARAMNVILWSDGTQDPNTVPGVRSIITDTVVGPVGGIDRGQFAWWQHRVALNLATSPAGQELTKKLRSEARQLKRFGGKPNKIFSGSKAIEAVEAEIFEKGFYTMEGFARGEKNDIGMGQVRMRGVGAFEYDPTLDDMDMAGHILFLDSRRIKVHVMEGEDNKTLTPTRPHNYLVFLKSMTWTGTLGANQLNCHGLYSIAQGNV